MDRRTVMRGGLAAGALALLGVAPALAEPAANSYVTVADAEKYWKYGIVQRDLAELAYVGSVYDANLRYFAEQAVGTDEKGWRMRQLKTYADRVAEKLGEENVSFGYGMITTPGNNYVSIVDGIHWQVKGCAPGNAYDPKYWDQLSDGQWYMIGTPLHLIGA